MNPWQPLHNSTMELGKDTCVYLFTVFLRRRRKQWRETKENVIIIYIYLEVMIFLLPHSINCPMKSCCLSITGGLKPERSMSWKWKLLVDGGCKRKNRILKGKNWYVFQKLIGVIGQSFDLTSKPNHYPWQKMLLLNSMFKFLNAAAKHVSPVFNFAVSEIYGWC